MTNGAKKWFSAISNFILLNRDWLMALLITTISLVFSLLTFYTVEFKQMLGFNRAYLVVVSLVVLQLFLTYGALAFYKSLSFFQKVVIWLQSNVLSSFVFLYYIRLNDSNLQVGGLSLTTRFIVVVLSVLIFLVNYNLFGKYKKSMGLIIAQVFFLIFTTFSFLSFAEADRSVNKDFTSDLLYFVFHLHPFFWFVITSISISLVSVVPINDVEKGLKRLFNFFGLSFFINLQIIMAVYFLGISELGGSRLTYWYLTLLVLIFWDLIYNPLVNVIKDVIDYKFKQRIFVSGLYHVFLFLLVLFYNPIVDLLSKIISIKWH